MSDLVSIGWLVAVFALGMFAGGMLMLSAVEKEVKGGRLFVGKTHYDVTPAKRAE